MKECRAELSRRAGVGSQVVIDGVWGYLVPRADVQKTCPDSVTVSCR